MEHAGTYGLRSSLEGRQRPQEASKAAVATKSLTRERVRYLWGVWENLPSGDCHGSTNKKLTDPDLFASGLSKAFAGKSVAASGPTTSQGA